MAPGLSLTVKERLRKALELRARALLERVGASEGGEGGRGGDTGGGDAGAPLPAFAVEAPRSPDHGDFATNLALVLAGKLRRPAREIARELVAALGDAGGLLAGVDIAGPGFVNLRIADDHWRAGLADLLRAGTDYGARPCDRPLRVQVEFVSANPTGPLTLGHGRQAILGDCIARLLEAQGHDVTREYYFNDGGRQMRVLGQSVRARYHEARGCAAPPPGEALEDPDAPWPERIGELPVLFPRDGYRGAYIGAIAADLVREDGDGPEPDTSEARFRREAQQRIFRGIRATLDALDVVFDVYSNETALYQNGGVDAAVTALRERGLVAEADGATWFRATELGLGRDRVLVRSNGEPTYLLPDIAYHREKLRRGFERVIDVQGADHVEQFPYVRAAVAALGGPADAIEWVMHQFVTLTRGGAQVKQTTRRGNYVTVDEVLERVDRDVFRFFMVQRKAEGHLDFDLDLARERDWKKNPAYSIQYAHARTCGILRRAERAGVPPPSAEGPDPRDLEPLALPEELALIQLALELPEVVDRATEQREPHHVAYYLLRVAGAWNAYLQDGVRHRVVSDAAALTAARLALARAVQIVLANGLGLLGIAAPEQM